MLTRGDIHYIFESETSGSEMRAGRPAIIVSNNKCNSHSSVIEIVYLTTKSKTDLPTHVAIRSASKPSIAVCEQISSVNKSRVGSYIGTCTTAEMDAVNIAIAISLAIDYPLSESNVGFDNIRKKLSQAESERDMYKSMYKDILIKLNRSNTNGC